MRSINNIIRLAAITSAAVVCLAAGACAITWEILPEPIHAYALVFDGSANQWIPLSCPRPLAPRIRINPGTEVRFRVIDRTYIPAGGMGTSDCSPPDVDPWDKDQWSDPYREDDIVCCDWDFDDGSAGIKPGSITNRQYTIAHTFQNEGLYYVRMRAWDNAQAHYSSSRGVPQPMADDEDVVQYVEVFVGTDDDWQNVESFTYTYNDCVTGGDSVTIKNPNHTSTVWTYDERHRLQKVENRKTDVSLMPGGAVEYSVDGVGNRTEIKLLNINSTWQTTAYGYDDMNRLTSEGATSFTYDWVGNRLSVGLNQYFYDKADRLLLPGTDNYYLTGSLKLPVNGVATYVYDGRELLSTVR